MAESKKKELEIHGEMMTLLPRLRENEIRVRKKVPMAPTSKQEIKADVRKILEQFLKKQQLKDYGMEALKYAAAPSQRLQFGAESETDYTDYDEAAPPQTLQSGTESETDDTDDDEGISPNEDEEEIAEGRARPAMWRQGRVVCRAGPPQRLQSGTESETDDTDLGKEFISHKEDIERIPVGTARGLQRLMSETEPKTDGTDYEGEFISRKKDKKKIPVGKPMSAMGLKSGLESETDDTDYEEEVIYRRINIERRKVGTAKPAMGRQRMMSGTESDTDDSDYRSVIKERWKSRKKKDIDSNVNKKRDVFQNVHTHKYSHVEQHHYTSGNKSGMWKERGVWECKDLAGKHSNTRETMRPRHATSGRTNSEKDRLYTAVAGLEHIGDHYMATSPLSDSTRSSVDHTATRRASARTPNLPGVDERGSDGLTALERQVVATLREKGDSCSMPPVMGLPKTLVYGPSPPQRLQSETESEPAEGIAQHILKWRDTIWASIRRMTRALQKISVYGAGPSQRLQSGTESETDDNDYRSVIIKRWKSSKKDDIGSSVDKMSDVVHNVNTHKYSHVEQHHYTNGNKSGMLMESEVWECEDLAGKSEHKQGERHSNIRETMRPRHATSGRTNSEKDRLYTAVAEKLVHIGDHYKATSPLSDSTRSSVDHTATRRASVRTPNLPGVDERASDGLTALERQLIDTLREVGDSFQDKLSPDAFNEIAKQAMYQKFKEVVDKETGPGNSWDHIAAVFYLTKRVVTMAGVGRAVALQVKDMAAEYVADKFATWIVDQGGWDTFLGSDSDLD